MEDWRSDVTEMWGGDSYSTAIDTGPGTYVALVHGGIVTGLTLRVRVLCNQPNVQDTTKWYAIEDMTLAAQTDTNVQTGFQSTPIPLPSTDWRFFTRIDLVGTNPTGTLIMYEVLKL